MRISIRGWDIDFVDPADLAERDKTRFVLQSGWRSLTAATFSTCLVRPVQFARALALAVRMGWRAERPLPVHLIYLIYFL